MEHKQLTVEKEKENIHAPNKQHPKQNLQRNRAERRVFGDRPDEVHSLINQVQREHEIAIDEAKFQKDDEELHLNFTTDPLEEETYGLMGESNMLNVDDQEIDPLFLEQNEQRQSVEVLTVNVSKRNSNPGSPKVFRKHKKDTSFVAPYFDSILKSYVKNENKYSPNMYMHQQNFINKTMRAITVDWLIDVSRKYSYSDDTLYLTVNLLDRYLSKKRIQQRFLQLVGITSFFIAAKYCEVYVPTARELSNVTSRAYSSKQILKMEQKILITLQFRLTAITPFMILDKFVDCIDHTEKMEKETKKNVRNAIYFLGEISLIHYEYIQFSPTHLSAACAYVAAKLFTKKGQNFEWNSILEYYSGKTLDDLKYCIKLLKKDLIHQFSKKNERLTAPRRKYQRDEFGNIATKVRVKLSGNSYRNLGF